jgi:polar amino acid transport system permease protein
VPVETEPPKLEQESTDLEIRDRLHIGRYVAAAISLVLIAWMSVGAVRNPRFEWGVVWEYMFDDAILAGLRTTLVLTAVAMAIAIVLGVVLAIMRLSGNPVLQSISWIYVWVFRAVPTLVQLIVWFNLGALYPKLSIGIPFGPEFITGEANSLISAWTAALLGLGLHEAAYMAEIIRSGIEAVDRGQREAALALGMSRAMVMRRIVLRQAFRIIIPPTGNQVISLLKVTSLVSVIALSDLLYSAQVISARNFLVIPLLIVISIWYLFITSVLMVGQHYLERYMSRSDRDAGATDDPRAGGSKAVAKVGGPDA